MTDKNRFLAEIAFKRAVEFCTPGDVFDFDLDLSLGVNIEDLPTEWRAGDHQVITFRFQWVNSNVRRTCVQETTYGASSRRRG